MKKETFLTVLLLGILTFSSTGLALNPQKKITQYVIDTWGLEDGLPQISIRSIIQARDGYLWLGTEEGVVRFDGVRFEVYNKNKVEQLKNNWIDVLFEDRKGNLRIGTYAGGLTCFYPQEGKFTTITKEQGLVHNRVWSICEDHEGNLWIGTEGGLNRLKNGKIITYTTEEGLSDNRVKAIIEDREGNLWIGTDGGGLNRLKQDKFSTYTTKEGLADDRVMALYEDSTGNLWIGTDNGLNCLEPGHENPRTYTTREGLSSNRIRSIYEDRDKNLWIGTYDGGVNRREQGKFTKYPAQEGLSDVCIWCIYEDREGSLWIGTYTRGLYRLQDGKFTTYSRSEGLSDDVVKSVCEGPDGRIWIGTDGGGLNCLRDGKFTYYTTKEGLSDNQVKCLYIDQEENLWIGTAKGGLNCFKDGKFTVYTRKRGLAENLVRSICEDRDGALWIGTGAGLDRFKDGKFTLYSTKQGLTGDIIRCIYEDREGNLWVGTDGGGLNCLKDGKFTAFTARDGLVNDTVWCILEDRQKYLWIGTSGGGLSCRKNGKFINITTREGLFDDTIHQILEDDSGNLWLSCNKGIFQVSRQEIDDFIQGKIHSLNCISYNEHDGMKSRECNGGIFPNGCKTRDGNLWFPTIKGAVTVNPNSIQKNMQPPPVRIEEIIVDNREIKSPLITASAPLVLLPGKNKLEIHFTDLSFQDAKKVLFKWKLEGFDNEWNDGGTRRTAYYSKVPPGDYTFRVKACNNDGKWNVTGASVSFSLEPYFHQALWFQVLCVLAFFFIVFGGYRLRVRFLKKREEDLTGQLRTQVEARTRDLEKRQKDLQERNEVLEAIDGSIKAINREFQLEKVFKSILHQAMKLCPLAEKGTFLIYDAKNKHFRVAANLGAHSTSEKNITLTYKEAIRRYTERTDQLKNGVYVLQEFKGAAGEEKLKNLPVPQATLAMSVIMEEKPQGFLILDSMGDPNAFDHTAIQRLIYFREHAILAMSKAGALEQLQQEKVKTERALAKLKKTNEELKEAKKTAEKEKQKAEEANKFKTQFLANMSHDIRNHMHSILGFSQVLESEITDEEQKRNLEAISSSANDLQKLIDNILDLSRIEAGKMELENEPLNLRSILDDIKQKYSSKAREKALDFQLGEVDPALPEVVIMDRSKLHSILDNLVNNAVKYTDSGFIKLSVQKIGPHVTPPGSPGARVNIGFSVQDSGRGIPKDQQKTIFNRYERQKGKHIGKIQGSGLGLTITRALVELMGGKISLQSREGKGSTFHVTLENVTAAHVAIEPGIDKLDVDNIRFEKATVLVADESAQNRRLLMKYLSQSPIHHIEAENGKQAVEMTKRHRPDLVLMDMKIAAAEGFKTTHLIKADNELKDIPVIIITASALKEQRPAIKKTGANSFLTKPVKKCDLIIELTNFLDWKYTRPTGPGKSPAIKKVKPKITFPTSLSPGDREKLQKLVNFLQGEDLNQRLKTLIKRFIINDIENFAMEVKKMAEKYQVEILYHWADKLINDINTFNRSKIENTLSSFPGVIKDIAVIARGSSKVDKAAGLTKQERGK
jgi:ligand-binding sensor domain-containing protein/signal transduction histidine kinase/response regulator RpfG family c-di-GMP phosphodiesterase